MLEILLAIFKTGSGSLIILILSVVTTKIFAVLLGPSGVGLYSLIKQTRDLFVTLTSFNGSAALVQGLAQREGSEREKYASAVFLVVIITSLLVSVFLFVFAPWLAPILIPRANTHAVTIVRWLTLPVLFGTIVFYFVGVLNGNRALGRLVVVQVVVAIATVVLALPTSLFVQRGYQSAFVILMAISSATGSLGGLFFVYRNKWLPSLHIIMVVLKNREFVELAVAYLSFALAMMITGFAQSGVILAVRTMTARYMSLDAAGYFDVGWTLSALYTTLLLSSFGAYYLPTLTQSKDEQSSSILISRVLLLMIILFVPFIVALTVLKPIVVQILYSKEFLPSLTLLRWMLIGSFFKVTSWVFSVTILASGDKKIFFWTEIIWLVGFLSFSTVSIVAFHSLTGVGIGFIVSYVLYLLYVLFYARSRYRYSLDPSLVVRWGIGLSLVLLVSIRVWNTLNINWVETILWIAVAVVFSILSIKQEERKKAITMLSAKTIQFYKR